MKKPADAGIAIEIQRGIFVSRCSGKPETTCGFEVVDRDVWRLQERLKATYADIQLTVPSQERFEVDRKWPS